METYDIVKQYILDKKDMRNFSKEIKNKLEEKLGEKITSSIRDSLFKKFGVSEALEFPEDGEEDDGNVEVKDEDVCPKCGKEREADGECPDCKKKSNVITDEDESEESNDSEESDDEEEPEEDDEKLPKLRD